MSQKHKLILRSYGRALLVVWMTLLSAGVTKWQAYLAGLVVAVLSPWLRWLDRNEKDFGRVIDAVEETARGIIDRAVTDTANEDNTK